MFPIYDKNPTFIRAFVTTSIFAICVLAFFWQISHDIAMQNSIVYALGVTPAVLFGDISLPAHLQWIPEPLTAFTSMFLHGGWMHIIGNMLYLWVFGNNIEAAMGHGRFILFYLCCGLAAVLAQAIPDMQSTIPMIGASGAISGILGAYLLLYPRAIVTLLIPIFFYLKTIDIEAKWVLIGWFCIQLIQSIMTAGSDGSDIAFGAHIGGFIAGIILCPIFKKKQVPIQLFRRAKQ